MPSTYEPIQSISITSSGTATISFTSIPQTYTDLRVSINGITAVAGGMPLLRFNSDTSTNYAIQEIGTAGSTPGGLNTINTANCYMGGYGAWSTTTPSLALIDIMSYTNTTLNKGGLVLSPQTYPSGTSGGYMVVGNFLWRSTAAITSIQLTMYSGNYGDSVIATLYGIKAA